MLKDPDQIVHRLRTLQRLIRTALIASRGASDLHAINRQSSADTIYQIDDLVEPILIRFLEDWGREQPLVVIAEGLEPETGRTFPAHISPDRAELRIILDPIDGTRPLMYDKRSAWSLAGVAPNRGVATRLRDIEVAVMTELPTSKLGLADVLWAVKGQRAHAVRENLFDPDAPPIPLPLRPSSATTLEHGFAPVTAFFPDTRVLAARLAEEISRQFVADLAHAPILDDQYISTGGQLYELIVGHDRFNADLRPHFFQMQKQPQGFCCHPYDLATILIAEEAGVILTDGAGDPLDGPLDVTTGISWIAYANPTLRRRIEPVIAGFQARHVSGVPGQGAPGRGLTR